jgi:hypothetical protein
VLDRYGNATLSTDDLLIPKRCGRAPPLFFEFRKSFLFFNPRIGFAILSSQSLSSAPR